MSENILQNIIQKKIEKVDNLKKSLDLKTLDEFVKEIDEHNNKTLHIALEKAREISLLPRPLPGMTTVPLSIHMSPSIP